MQFDPYDLERFFPYLKDYDIIISARAKRQDRAIRKYISSVDKLLLKLLFSASFQDLHWIKFVRKNFLEKGSITASSPFVAWLAGRWVGPALGGEAEEIWSPPSAGAMIGMYRLVRDGRPIFYEFQTMVEENGSLTLRLKHFNPHLIGWEEKQKTIDFPLVALADGVIQFEGMSFHRQALTHSPRPAPLYTRGLTNA